MLVLEKMAHRQITSANYITSVNGMLHPDRTLPEHDFLYMLDGGWEIIEDGHIYEMQRDDLLILRAGRHHLWEKTLQPRKPAYVLSCITHIFRKGRKKRHGRNGNLHTSSMPYPAALPAFSAYPQVF